MKLPPVLSFESIISPSLAKLQAHLQLQKVVVALLPAHTYSFELNLEPKLDWMQHELRLLWVSTEDLRVLLLAAPSPLGCSLERRYHPRPRAHAAAPNSTPID